MEKYNDEPLILKVVIKGVTGLNVVYWQYDDNSMYFGTDKINDSYEFVDYLESEYEDLPSELSELLESIKLFIESHYESIFSDDMRTGEMLESEYDNYEIEIYNVKYQETMEEIGVDKL